MSMTNDLAPWAICSVLFITVVFIGSFLLSTPHTDAEPLLLKPSISCIGHLIPLLRDRAVFFRNIHQVRKPIVSLPLGPRWFGLGKSHVIFNPSLQKAAMTHKNMDPRDTAAAYIPPLHDIKKSTLTMWMGRDGVHESWTHPMHEFFQNTLKGEHLNIMTFRTLEHVAGALESVGSGNEALPLPSLYYWLRGMMTQAISAGLYGLGNNPYLPAVGEGYEMAETLWDFIEDGCALSIGFLPSILGRKGYIARAKLADVMVPSYKEMHYQGEAVSALVKERARLFLEWDTPVDEMAKQELAVLSNGVSNTVPTLFWMTFHIF